MNELPTLESALYGGQDAGGYRFLARSAGFREEWLPEAERLCTGFGERPAGVCCPHAVFAQPFDRERVALVQAADQGKDDQGRPGALAFHIVLIPTPLYAHLGGDPFYLAERLPPVWSARGILSPLTCPAPSPRRLVADVQKVLQAPHSAALLGGAQALLDGGRLVFERPAPAQALLRDLWTLLPLAARADYWPASFAFGNALHFHAVAVPRVVPEQFDHYLTETQAGDYPEGKYEYELQHAAEHNDQDTLDGLFARRSYREMQRIAFLLLVVVILLPLAAGLLRRQDDKPPVVDKQPPEPPPVPFVLPPPEAFPRLAGPDREAFRRRLLALLEQVKVRAPQVDAPVLLIGVSRDPLTAAGLLTLSNGDWLSSDSLMLDALDRRLGTPDPERSGGPLRHLGPLERQVRGLVWKHAVESYNDPRLKPAELLERLQEKVKE